MKNVSSLLLFLFAISPVLLHAQKQFGLKLGANVGNVDEQIKIFDNTNLVGFEEQVYKINYTPQVGIWLDLPLTSRLSLQPELLWTQKAFEPEENNPDNTYINFHYFSAPLLAKYKFRKWRIELGAEASFLLDQSLENADSPQEESPFIEEHTFEFAALLGVQFQHNRWMLGVRGSRDLTDFQNFDIQAVQDEVVATIKHFHQSVTLWVGYQIL